jgi:hypothetical protein
MGFTIAYYLEILPESLADLQPGQRYSAIQKMFPDDEGLTTAILEGSTYTFMDDLIQELKRFRSQDLEVFISTMDDRDASNGVIFSKKEAKQIYRALTSLPCLPRFDRFIGRLECIFSQAFHGGFVSFS